ncbi:MAG TPA: penicillin-binding protein 2 [Caldisericia bacterium]|nr:penicillin-binding protein 2 [Caldisericia bacterium]HXK50960.1 penicillin-binding protein 2 [Caldisericia bacterium]
MKYHPHNILQGLVDKDIHPFKMILFSFLIVVSFVFLLVRIFQMQAFHQEKYKNMAINNYSRTLTQESPRGNIYDRNGIVVAKDVPTFHLYASPNEIPDIKHVASLLEQYIGLPQETTVTTIEEQYSYSEVLLKENLTYEEKTRIEENKYKLKGIFMKEGFKRYYPHNSSLCHVLGYTGMITKDDLQNPAFVRFKPNERIGQTGIERYYEDILHGHPGIVHQTINVFGSIQKETTEKDIIKGDDVYLTVDIRLQKKAEEILSDHRGCLLLMNIPSGEILTFVSNPGFDPNFFSGPRPVEKWNQWIENRAFFNIASMGQYPPGSTFKPLIALYGLKESLITQQENILCEGSLDIPGQKDKYRCWVYPSSHGYIKLIEAIQVSCDVFFYKLADRFNIEGFVDFAVQYGGISRKTGIDLTYEESGFLGTPEWKEKFKGVPWYRGDSMNLGIGQGFLSVTPLQMTKLYGIIAARDSNITPHLLKKTSTEKTFIDLHPQFKHQSTTFNISEEYYKLVLEGLYKTTVYPGTATGLNIPSLHIAAKTGTALVEGQRETQQHLWMGAMFPYEKPSCVAFIMFENSSFEYASELAPYLKDFILYYDELY